MASHLSVEERQRVSELRADHSRSRIARVLALAKSTISREIKRNRCGCLYALFQSSKCGAPGLLSGGWTHIGILAELWTE